MSEPSPPSDLRNLLRNLAQGEGLDEAYLLAGTFNLYLDSLRRRSTRTLLGPDDIFAICEVFQIILGAGEAEAGVAQLARRKLP